MAKVVFLVGLPGAGKSTHLKRFEGTGKLCFDDFKAHAVNNSSRFDCSRHYQDLLSTLRSGAECIVSDVDFCRPAARKDAEKFLNHDVAGIEMEWIFFENNPEQCKKNVIARGRNSFQHELITIQYFTRVYKLPVGCIPIPVVKPSKS
jgi:predicted kinase